MLYLSQRKANCKFTSFLLILQREDEKNAQTHLKVGLIKIKFKKFTLIAFIYSYEYKT